MQPNPHNDISLPFVGEYILDYAKKTYIADNVADILITSVSIKPGLYMGVTFDVIFETGEILENQKYDVPYDCIQEGL